MPVLVVGLGSFGGGVGVARYLVAQGARVTITDLKQPAQLTESIEALSGLPLTYRLGAHHEADLDRAELVVASPAVPPGSPFIQAARRRGLPITSEMNLFFSQCPGQIIGITGSNGKTTTTLLTGAILEQSGVTTHVGGNLGRSLLDVVGQIQPDDRVVLELSSFQLEDLDRLGRSPAISVLTNLTPNHLDRHGTFEAYVEAKRAIFRHQDADGLAVLNADDPETRARVAPHCRGQVRWFSVERSLPQGLCIEDGAFVERSGPQTRGLAEVSTLRIPGRHNQANLLAAAAAALAAGALPADVRAAAGQFSGAPHRLELVGQDTHRRFYNDSIATTPESTIAGLEALQPPIYVLVGGSDKGCALEPLAAALRERAAGAVLLGALGDRLAPLLGEGLPTRRATSFRQAFSLLLELGEQGTLLLSPAAASYDEFNNFSERGALFARLVAERLDIA